MKETESRLRALMLRGLEGDAAAHTRLLGELAPLLRAYFARRMGGDHADGEDLVQETLIAIHTRRESYDQDRPFTVWAYALARYKMVDEFRRRGGRRSVSIDSIDDLFAPDEQDGVDASLDVQRLLSDLPDGQRQSIADVKVEGLSIVESAARSGMSPSNVKVSIHRGLRTMMSRVRKGETDAD